MSLLLLSLFLLLPPMLLYAAAGDECHRSTVGKETLFLGLFSLNFLAPTIDRKSTRLNSSHSGESRMPSSA